MLVGQTCFVKLSNTKGLSIQTVLQIQSIRHKQQNSASDAPGFTKSDNYMHFDNIFGHLQKTVARFLEHQVTSSTNNRKDQLRNKCLPRHQ